MSCGFHVDIIQFWQSLATVSIIFGRWLAMAANWKYDTNPQFRWLL